MSKFFHSSATDTSTSDLSDPPESPIENGTALANLQIDPLIREHQSQMMLHSLLEEKCMIEATRQWTALYGDREIDHGAIQQIAKDKYHGLVQQLARNQLLLPGFERDAFSSTRQQMRNGLDILISRPGIQPSGELLVENDRQLQLVKFQDTDVDPIHRAGPSHYLANFEEIGILGKGGYGVVYQVRHKLDRQEYAIKKVPISAARAQRIQNGGEGELARLLLEPRTMAGLDHPKVVRYYNSWVEYSSTGLPTSIRPSGLSTSFSENESVATFSDDDNAVLGAADDRSLQRITTVSDEADTAIDILFEHSNLQEGAPSSGDMANIPSSVTQSRSMAAGQPSDIFESRGIEDKGLTLPSAGPCYFLHLQMGLYPMSLADFLSPDAYVSRSVEAPVLRHCFHLQPTLSILLAIVNGLLYLHHKGTVHGDLKPANILMALNDNPRDRRGSVDLMLCDECRAAGQTHLISLNVRIGDFGLATALDEAPDAARNTPGGTTMYRPLIETLHDNTYLDIFALGIIAFELLWPFTTKMERHEALDGLKRSGTFPADGKDSIGDGRIRRCISQLLAGGITLSKLKQDLLALQDAYRSKAGVGIL
ncbi:hypothetical protein LTR86_001487 [Recurvomyces mirabilis]|nr:hypothetical protein LTR86_001487 [Recurvomyces mirabilis]